MVRGSARVRGLVTRRLHAGDRLAEVSHRTRTAFSEAGTRLRAMHAVVALALIVLLVFGSRALIVDGVPQVDSLRDWPGAGALWSTFFAAWREAMMGADAAASPVFGLMALWSTALLGDTDIARTLVVVGALPLGALGAYRLTRPFARSPLPAVTAAVAYAVNPIGRNAIAEGQLGPLVCFAIAPFIARALVRATEADDRRSRIHLVATVALLLLVVGAAWPPGLLLALLFALGFALAWPFVGGTRLVGRTAATAVVATLTAFVLLVPWSLTLIGADAATSGRLPHHPLDLVDVLSFHTGPAGAGIGAAGLLVSAFLPLVLATRFRLAWAARAWMVALLSFACAWLPARLDAGASTAAPEGVLVPAALGLAFAIGLGLAAFLEEMRTFRFGWRQFAAVAAAVGLALPVIGFTVDTFDGRWGMSNDDWPSRLSWMEEERDNGDFRVLWLGDPTILPTDVKLADDVGVGLTRQGPGDVRSLWAPPEGDAERTLLDAIGLVQEQHTVRLGHLVAPAGVRYIAYVTRAAPDGGARGRPDPALASALSAQLDLAVSRIEPGAIVYENQAWIPPRANVPADVEVPVDSDDPLVAAQRATLAGTEPVTGAVSDSDPAGPGTLLFAEAANSGWHASVDGERAPRRDAFGWTNAFALDRRGAVDISFSGGPRRLFIIVELLFWIAACVVWWRTRVRLEARTPMSDGMRRWPIVIVIAVILLVAVFVGDRASEPASVATADEATTLPAEGTRSSAWFCPGLPASLPLDAQTLTISNIGADEVDAIVTVYPDDGSAPVSQTIPVAGDSVNVLGRATFGPNGGVVVETFARDVVVEHGIESDQQLAIEPCASQSHDRWFFSAGTTGNFEAGTTGRPVEQWLMLFNPFGTDAARPSDGARERGGPGRARDDRRAAPHARRPADPRASGTQAAGRASRRARHRVA